MKLWMEIEAIECANLGRVFDVVTEETQLMTRVIQLVPCGSFEWHFWYSTRFILAFTLMPFSSAVLLVILPSNKSSIAVCWELWDFSEWPNLAWSQGPLYPSLYSLFNDFLLSFLEAYLIFTCAVNVGSSFLLPESLLHVCVCFFGEAGVVFCVGGFPGCLVTLACVFILYWMESSVSMGGALCRVMVCPCLRSAKMWDVLVYICCFYWLISKAVWASDLAG